MATKKLPIFSGSAAAAYLIPRLDVIEHATVAIAPLSIALRSNAKANLSCVMVITPLIVMELVLPAAGNYLRVDWLERPRRFVLFGNRQKREQHLGYSVGFFQVGIA